MGAEGWNMTRFYEFTQDHTFKHARVVLCLDFFICKRVTPFGPTLVKPTMNFLNEGLIKRWDVATWPPCAQHLRPRGL